MPANPYAAPAARVADDGAQAAPALWNPNAAASWSLLFTPAFGSFLHMLNWRALGEQEKAGAAKGWFIASLVLLAIYIVLVLAMPGFSNLAGFVFLLTWYFASARGQARYVKEKFGGDYPRKGWGKPLLLGVASLAGYFVLSFAAGLIAVLAGWVPPEG